MIKFTRTCTAAAACLFLLTEVAMATVTLFPTETAAAAACGAEEVVWVSLDNGRFFHKPSNHYGKGNGGFGCLGAAKANYRPGHD